MTDKPKQYRQRCGLPGGIYEWNANPVNTYTHLGWYEDKHGEKIPESFTENLKYSDKCESEEDLIEVMPYDGIAIDTPGWAELKAGDAIKYKSHFAGIADDNRPMIWVHGMTSWSTNLKEYCHDFIPKGVDE